MKFYRCKHCGNIIAYVERSGVDVVCCGEKMEEIIPGSVDASHEKHVPVINQNKNEVVVTVGSVEHPMAQVHNISWIALECKKGNQRKHLEVDGKPEAKFYISDDDEVIAAYAYCNLHGLWKKEK